MEGMKHSRDVVGEVTPLVVGSRVGDVVHLEVERLNSTAEGVAHLDGLATFVPGSLPGEVVEAAIARKAATYARANPTRLLTRSAHRQIPRCPMHLRPSEEGVYPEGLHCGGCQLQVYEREQELEYKRSMVQEVLWRVGKIETDVLPVQYGSPWGYRNKMSFALSSEDGRLEWGQRSHEDGDQIVALPSCEIAHPELWDVGQQVIEGLRTCGGPELVWNGLSGTVRGVTLRRHTGRVAPAPSPEDRASTEPVFIALFAITDAGTQEADRIEACLRDIPNLRVFFTFSDPRATAVHYNSSRFLNRKPGRPASWGEAAYREEICAWHTIGPWPTLVGPTNFLQVNDEMAERLYQQVLDLPFEGTHFAIDTYCGVGLLTRALAKRFEHVMGIELDTQAIKLARTTSRRLQDCRVEWVAEAAEAVFSRSGRNQIKSIHGRPNAVILDPPRKGCQEEVLRTLLDLQPADIVYVSCHPAALARDLKTLCQQVYQPVRVEPFDLFPQTHHVETLVHLKKR